MRTVKETTGGCRSSEGENVEDESGSERVDEEENVGDTRKKQNDKGAEERGQRSERRKQ